MSASDEHWLSDLNHPEPKARHEAVWMLGSSSGYLSAEAVAALTRTVADTDPGVASSALSRLAGEGVLDEPAARELIVRGLRDSRPDVRRTALGAIKELAAVRDSGWIVIEILERLEDDNGEVEEAALYGLSILPPAAYIRAFGPSDRSLDEWIAEATAGDRCRRVGAMLALEPFGIRALDALASLSSDPDPVVRRVALFVLGHIGPDALPIVRSGLEDAEPYVRIDAIRALGKMGADAAPILAGFLSDSERAIRWAAAGSLEALGSDARAATPELIEMLRRSDEPVGYKAALALAAIGAGHAATVPALIEALGSSEPMTQDASARALSVMGADAVAAIVPLLKAGVSSPFHLDRLLSGAKAVAPGAVAAVLGEALADENADVRRAAAAFLAAPDLREHAPVDLLVAACRDPDPCVRYEVAATLGDLGAASAPAVDALVEVMEREAEDDELSRLLNPRRTAAGALGRIGPKAASATPALLRRLKAPDPQMQLAAAWSLSRVDPKIVDGLPILMANLDSTREPNRRNAAEALGNLGPLASEAIPALEKLLDDEIPAVRREAETALRRIKATSFGT